MEAHNYNFENTIVAIVSEYEAMSQKGTVGFFEEKVFLKLILYYKDKEELDRALEVADHALLQYAFSIQFHSLKSQILMDKGFYHAALECLEKAELFAPEDFEIQLLRVEAFIAKGYTEDAFVILERIKPAADKGKLSDIYFYQACIYEHDKDFENMFYALKEAVLLNPDHEQAMKRIWLSVELSALFEEAIELYNELIDIDAYNSIAWYNLGYAWFCLADYRKATEAFEYAYLIDKHFEFAYRDCAESWIKLEEYDKALACFEEALEVIKPDASFLLRVGYCYENKEHYDVAISYYKQCIELAINDDAAYFRIGECFVKQRNWRMAIQSFETAYELNDRKEEYLAALAECWYQLDNFLKAEHYFRKATDTAPEISRYWIQYATFLMEIARPGEALELLEEAHMYSFGAELQFCRIVCLLMNNERNKALYELREVLDDHYELHDTLFDLMPDLQNDPEVQSVISAYIPG